MAIFEKLSSAIKHELDNDHDRPEELSLLPTSRISRTNDRRHRAHSDDESSLPTSPRSPLHQRHRGFLGLGLRRRRFESRRDTRLLISIILVTLLALAIVLSLYLDLVPLGPPPDSVLIQWSDRPVPARHWSNYYGFVHPPVGSASWRSLYPPSKPAGPLPRLQWVNRYNHLRSISSPTDPGSPLSATWTTPQAALSRTNGLAQYPPETVLNAGADGICSYRRASCLRGKDEDRGLGLEDIWFGKKGTWAVNFDDGPLPPSASLYKLLDVHEEKATHFWIGSNVRDHPELALQAFRRGDHLAVHTWTHAHLTTLSDLEIIGELGWTMQVISDLTGLVPLYYRPPYGDVDNRVRALAKHVLGLTTLLWNCDSSDWTLNQTYAIGDFVDPPMGGFGVRQAVGSINVHANQQDKTVGKIILEHELSEESVSAFEMTIGNVKKNGWKTCAVPECLGAEWYQTA